LNPATEELTFQVNATVCATACTPVPVSVIVPGEPEALLVTVMLPLTAPAALGSKITLNVNVCDGFNVTAPAPFSEYPVPLTVIAEICTEELPVFVIVSLRVAVVEAMFTLPNARVGALNDSVFVAATPVPLNATVVGEFAALLTMFTVPGKLPVAVGANTALKVTLDPAATVLGTESPFTE
jgi:hypothetical protein